MSDDPWLITSTRHDAKTLAQFNSVFTISNGYLGLKGNLCEARQGPCPVTLINGVYNELDMFSTIPASSRERPWLDPTHFDDAGRSPAVANLPNPLHVQDFVADRELTLERGEIRDFRARLDLRRGLFEYEFVHRDAAGNATRIHMQRFASLVHAHRVYMRYTVRAENHELPIRVHSGITGSVHSSATGECQFAITSLDANGDGRCTLTARTPARGIDVHMGVAHAVRGSAGRVSHVIEHNAVCAVYQSTPSEPLTIDRAIVLTCSEDERHGVAADPAAELDAASRQGFDAALQESEAAWTGLWDASDVQIDGDDAAQRYLRFCLHHLLAAAPRFSDRLSVPVKLLSGDYYQGNTFYDTDTYILPFYTFTQPALARTCVNFRWHGLEHGREIARRLGCGGAKLAWQAGPYGEECLGDWYWFTRTNVHINADACYALVQYVRASGDEEYLRHRGVDLLAESARFYASRAVYDADRDAFDIHDVAGPDEGHCHSTNNFYTNTLAAWTLRQAARVAQELQSDVAIGERLQLRPDEPARWRNVADKLTFLFDSRTRVYEQFDGLYELPPPPAELLANRSAWFEPLYPWQALNQPDVLMAMALFREAYEDDVKRANYDYYYDLSMNFSSMSFVINAIISADVGRIDEAHRNFIISAGMDVDESLTGRRDTHAGLHGTAMGGAWMAAVFGFGGVNLCDDRLRIEPRLPATWDALRFNLLLRGERVRVEIDRSEVCLRVGDERGIEIPAIVAGRELSLGSGGEYRQPLPR